MRHCEGAHTLLHITATGSGYFENVWAWTADHDLDNHLAQGQISIYVGRGVVVSLRLNFVEDLVVRDSIFCCLSL